MELFVVQFTRCKRIRVRTRYERFFAGPRFSRIDESRGSRAMLVTWAARHVGHVSRAPCRSRDTYHVPDCLERWCNFSRLFSSLATIASSRSRFFLKLQQPGNSTPVHRTMVVPRKIFGAHEVSCGPIS